MSFSSIFFAVVPASWRHAYSSSSSIGVVDVEAQTVSGTRAPYVLPAEPEQARVVPARTRPRTPYATATITSESLTSSTTVADVNAMDDFLGGVTHVHESRRHDSSSSSNPDSVILEVLPPPPYVDTELPAYSLEPIDEEPDTLAKYMFTFGFLFPLFWILGAVILVSPLTLPRDLEPSKSREELELCERVIRAAEVKWAKRCAWALFTLLVLAAFVGAVIAVVVVKMYP